MDSWLNYHHLYYFKTIASEGSIAKAAKILRLGQPTLSAQLRQLEDKLGIQLFERQHKKLILTEQGRIALEYSSEIFRMGSEMVEVLHDRLIPTRTHVQLGALDSIPKHLIARLIEAAYRAGNCTVSVLEGGDSELVRELLAHRIDLILTNHPPSVADDRKLFMRSLAKLPVVLCASPKFRDLKKNFPKSLDQVPFVMPTRHSKLRQDIDHYLNTHGIQPDIVAEIQDTSLQKILGAHGIGVLPINELGAASLIKKGDLVKVGTLEGIHEELFLVSASRKIENPISSRLLKNFTL
jgi:LysR family transcriptional activator of nhaA